MTVFNNLDAEMRRKRITQEELAIRMGINPSTLSQKMTGKREFSLTEAKKIKHILEVNIPIEELFSVIDSA